MLIWMSASLFSFPTLTPPPKILGNLKTRAAQNKRAYEHQESKRLDANKETKPGKRTVRRKEAQPNGLDTRGTLDAFQPHTRPCAGLCGLGTP